MFSGGLGRDIRRSDVALKDSGAETESTTGDGVELGDVSTLTLEVDVTDSSGTSPTLLVEIEGSDNGTDWVALGAIGSNGYRAGSLGTTPDNITGTGTHRAVLPAARHVRSKSTVGGTSPSFTYAVTATAS